MKTIPCFLLGFLFLASSITSCDNAEICRGDEMRNERIKEFMQGAWHLTETTTFMAEYPAETVMVIIDGNDIFYWNTAVNCPPEWRTMKWESLHIADDGYHCFKVDDRDAIFIPTSVAENKVSVTNPDAEFTDVYTKYTTMPESLKHFLDEKRKKK